jgi:mRNA-degrading endonuclease RelE of RelBE toxin-antitoxin system
MKINKTESYVRDFVALPKDIQARVEKAIRFIVTDPRYPSLQVKKMEPKKYGIFEARISLGYRMTFTVAPREIILRRVGTHDILRRP